MPLSPPLVPRNGNTLKVLLPARVSDPRPGKQDERSLRDQRDIQEKWLNDHCEVAFEVTVIAGSGSGELLDRAEFQDLIERVESRAYDLVLTEDIGRITRRVRAFHVCELCEDCETRLIAINNHGIDTARPGWRDAAFFASFFYERENRERSTRLKGRLRSQFLNGGALPDPIYGYTKPRGAKHDSEMLKDPAAEPVYRRWFQMLDDGASYAEVADWLNANGVPLPPTVRGETWTGSLVGRHTHNPILKGLRQHNKRKTKRQNDSGRYVSVKAAPEELLERHVPHLAFFDEAYYDAVVGKIKQRNAKYRRTNDPSTDPLRQIPKKRVRYPGQCIWCGICGRPYVFGGHGQRDHLMCIGAKDYVCWNGVTVDGPLAAQKISIAVFEQINALEGFDETYLKMVQEEGRQLEARSEIRRTEIDQQIATLTRNIANLVGFLKSGQQSAAVREELVNLEADKALLQTELADLDRRPSSRIELPSVDTLKALAREEIQSLPTDSFEFARLMRKLMPRIVVFPHRLVDGSDLVLRAKSRLRVANLLPDVRCRTILQAPLERVLTVDLFEPPQRARHREEVVRLRAAGFSEQEAAAAVGITVTAAQRAAVLHRKMAALDVGDPYEPVTEPPSKGRMRRHRHPRYRFHPLDGAGEV